MVELVEILSKDLWSSLPHATIVAYLYYINNIVHVITPCERLQAVFQVKQGKGIRANFNQSTVILVGLRMSL